MREKNLPIVKKRKALQKSKTEGQTGKGSTESRDGKREKPLEKIS